MKILVACEESQAVAIELRKLGHEAYSCDIVKCSGGHPEWHIKQDVVPLLSPKKNSVTEATLQNGEKVNLPKRWDMIIAFPPCTHLAVSGARWFKRKRENGKQKEGIEFFVKFLNADCDKIAVENPVGIISGDYIKEHFPELCKQYNLPIKSTQIVQPYEYGDSAQKTTCLWLKNLPELKPTNIVEKGSFKEWVDKKSGKTKRQAQWYFDALKEANSPEERRMLRSKTFPGIAKAMANQWT